MKNTDFSAPLKIVGLSSEKTAGLCVDLSEQELEEALRTHMKEDALLIVWQFHRIVWGRWQAGAIHLADDGALDASLIGEMRAFNETEELHLVKKRGKFRGRYIFDKDGEGTEAVDSAAPLWGERTACAGGYATLADAGRGLSLTVPTEKEGERFALVTRCYIGYDPETQQAGYEDMRYKAVVPLEEG